MIGAVRVVLATCFVLTVGISGAQTPSPPVEDDITGLWVSETVFAPTLQGELTVSRKDRSWTATISNAASEFQAAGNKIVFSFPGNRGKFRGVLTENQRTIEGFWLQPARDPDDARGSGQAYAAPLVLERVRRGVWRGTVQPLPDTFTLYLKIYRGADGSLVGTFRNPETNSIGGASLFRVVREGDTVRISARPDPAEPEIIFDAKCLRSPDRLQIFWPDMGAVLSLVRRAPSEAPNFLPRPPGEPKYAYHAPPQTGDGWSTARAGDVGMDETLLEQLVGKLIDSDPTARRAPLIHSILVARRGKLVLDEYFFGFEREQPHDLRSAGKTFASVMLGAAMMRGVTIAPETKIYDLVAGMRPFANPDPRKSQITLAHLMTHTSGLACDDNDPASPGNESTMQAQREQPDWWKYTLDLPMIHDPGTHYAYCSANINLVSAALTLATHAWLPEWFERTVARPLQFGRYYWNLTPTGEGYLGGGAYLRPRDLLKVGQVFLDGGVWHGKRIVGASWVTRSTAPDMEISEATTGLTSDQFQNFYIKGDEGYASDGYAWHALRLRSGDRTYREYEASGNGGQLLIVVPELDLVVVLTGGNYRQGGIWTRWRHDIVGGAIVPAIRR